MASTRTSGLGFLCRVSICLLAALWTQPLAAQPATNETDSTTASAVNDQESRVDTSGSIDKKAATYFYERGLKNETAKDYNKAIADFTKAIQLRPDYGQAYWSRSSVLDANGQLRKAIADLTSFLELKPRDYSALFNRGLCYQRVRDDDKAIADYTQALDPSTDFSRNVGSKEECQAHAYHYRGRVFHWFRRDFEKAVADYTEALRLDPSLEMVHYRRGQAYNAVNQYANAETDFATALEKDPDYSNLLASWAWQLATCPNAEFRNGNRALELAKRAKFKSSRHLDVLAAAYAELGMFADAVATQEKALAGMGQRTFGLGLRSDIQVDLKQVMQARLELYRNRRAYRDET